MIIKALNKEVSIVIPSHTGNEVIGSCLDSILAQKNLQALVLEVVVVIDGPNALLRTIVEKYKIKFSKVNLRLEVHQLSKNRGRFVARLEGAKKSNGRRLLFVDDRVTLDRSYVDDMYENGFICALPVVEDSYVANHMTLAISRMRSFVYRRANNDTDSGLREPITIENFDKVPKGTAGLWIKRSDFFDAAQYVLELGDDLKNVSDDTKLLYRVIENGIIIERPHVTVKYQPRLTIRAEFIHMYSRGPLFIDYYLHPNKPYFWTLISFYLLTLLWLSSIIFYPVLAITLFIFALLGIFIIIIMIMNNVREIPQLYVGTSLTIIAFGTGLITGLIKKLVF